MNHSINWENFPCHIFDISAPVMTDLVRDKESSSDVVSDISGKGTNLGLSADERVNNLAQQYGINQRKLMMKVDVCVIPAFCFLYFLAFLDRVNISNARLYGLPEDLKLTGNQYNTALTLFFVPYIAFEVLSNFTIKLVKPHIWLSACILCFGAVSVGMGFVTNFGGLAACRFLLGIFEASTFPALFYLLSCYYPAHEAQRRFSAFFSVTCLAGAASGSIAYRIHEIDGKNGIAAWAWIFIIDGIITMGGAIILFFTIADFPEEARFLKEHERKFIKEKLEIYSGAESGFETKNTLGDVGRCFKDYLVWLPALAYFGLIIPSYGYAYFAATIINQMGYTAVSANQHSVYPWLAAFGLSNVVSVLSDRLRMRMPFAIATSCIAIVGLALVLAEKTNANARYAGCFLTASGLYTAMPLLVCWSSLNFGGHLRKSVGTAWQIGFGNIGGIIATFIFLAKDAPVYRPGLIVCLAAVAFAMAMMGGYFFAVYRLNAIKKTSMYQERWDQKTDREKILNGDKQPGFRYLY